MHYAIILIQFFSLLCYWGIGVSIPIWYHSHIHIILCSIMIYFLYPSSSILLVFKPHIKTIYLKLEYPSDTIIVSYCLVLGYTFNTLLIPLLYCIVYCYNYTPTKNGHKFAIFHLLFPWCIHKIYHSLNFIGQLPLLLRSSFAQSWS